jgi:NADH dehydrogenase/NADH:ubiquinone oxidoreductase subunit G
MIRYKRAFEDLKRKNQILEMRYRGEVAELQEREIERAKAVDMLIASLNHEQDVSKFNLELYLAAEKELKELDRQLKTAEWRIAKLERELEKARSDKNA